MVTKSPMDQCWTTGSVFYNSRELTTLGHTVFFLQLALSLHHLSTMLFLYYPTPAMAVVTDDTLIVLVPMGQLRQKWEMSWLPFLILWIIINIYILSLVSPPQFPKPLEFPKWIENGVFHHVNEVTFHMPLGYLRMELVARGTNILVVRLELSVPSLDLLEGERGWRLNWSPITKL